MKRYPRIPPDDERCSKPNVVDDTGWHFFRCKRRGAVKEGDQLWCKQHAPSSVKAHDEASAARYKAEWERRDAPYRKIERLEAINTDLLAALKASVLKLHKIAYPISVEHTIEFEDCRAPECVQARDAIAKAKLPA